MASADVFVAISAAVVGGVTPSSSTTTVTIGAAATALPPASSEGSGFYQNLGDGRGYIPLDLYIGVEGTDAQLVGAAGLARSAGFGTSGAVQVEAEAVNPASPAQSYVVFNVNAGQGSIDSPQRIRSAEPSRTSCIVSNIGEFDFQLAYGSSDPADYNAPSLAQWTAGITVPPGQEGAMNDSTNTIFVRPLNATSILTLGVLTTLGA